MYGPLLRQEEEVRSSGRSQCHYPETGLCPSQTSQANGCYPEDKGVLYPRRTTQANNWYSEDEAYKACFSLADFRPFVNRINSSG
jgi:hypothetical protein